MSLPGSCHVLADRVRGAAVQLMSPLKAAFLAEAGRVGGENFRTDAQLAAIIKRPNGASPHRESVGRVRRALARDGFIEATRVYAGQKIPAPGARFRSAHGVVVSRIVWSALSMKDPLKRRERAQARAAQRAAVREQEKAPAPAKDQPRFSAPVPSVPEQPTITEAIRDSLGHLPPDLPAALAATFERIETLRARRAREGPD